MPRINHPDHVGDHAPPSVEFLLKIVPKYTFGSIARFGNKWNFKIQDNGTCRVTLEADRDGRGLKMTPVEVEVFMLTTCQQVREFALFLGIRVEG